MSMCILNSNVIKIYIYVKTCKPVKKINRKKYLSFGPKYTRTNLMVNEKTRIRGGG